MLKINIKQPCPFVRSAIRALDSTVPEVIKNFDFTWVLPMVLSEREGVWIRSYRLAGKLLRKGEAGGGV